MIYLLRHGQTAFNAAGRMQGQLDSPLTAWGQSQAEGMGARLASLVGTTAFAVYVSPLGRTRASAAIVLSHLPPPSLVRFDPRLMEIGMGKWDGLTDYEIEAEYPGARAGMTAQQWAYHGPDGEDFATVQRRLIAAMADIAADPRPVKIVVSHGAVGRVIRGDHAGLTKDQMLALDAPQDALFALAADRVVIRIPC